MKKTIIGLTGPICSGKNEVLKILETKGFKGYKFSDAINKEILKQGQKINRTLQQDIGNEFRERFGADYWVKELLSLAQDEGTDLIVVDGLRNPHEVNCLKNQGGKIIAIDADYEVRKNRFLHRSKIGDPKTEEEFKHIEQRDRGVNEADSGQQVIAAMNLADIKIINNWNEVGPLQQEVEEIAKKLLDK
ncbi:AAA family ATPase [Patescibacteria group bacterium]|nr:AAA family ATPase [Patescibacteria group bacterium]